MFSLFKTQKHTSFYITDFHQINNLSEIIKNILIKNKRKNNKLHKINLTYFTREKKLTSKN